jgi:putative acetyltransferase
VRIRDERPADYGAIRSLLDEAFPGEPVARLVDDLRAEGDLDISLIAEIDGRLVGQVGFSPVAVSGCRSRVVQLSPLAVDASARRQGIGAELVRAGIERCRAHDVDAILVLGDPRYYTRFGFSPAAAAHLRSRWSGQHFMGLALRPDTLTECTFLSLAPAFERLP